MDFVKGLVGRGRVGKTLKPHRSFNLQFLWVPFSFFFFFIFIPSRLPSILLPSFIRLSGHKFTVSITADRNNVGLFRPLRIVACSTFKVLKNQFFFLIGENAVKNTGGRGEHQAWQEIKLREQQLGGGQKKKKKKRKRGYARGRKNRINNGNRQRTAEVKIGETRAIYRYGECAKAWRRFIGNVGNDFTLRVIS